MSRPYFETKVVKVKKEWTPGHCPCCGAKREAEKPKGNWVNSENLDKIKFPCLCSYKQPLADLNEHLGIIEYVAICGEKARYILLNIEGQRRGCKLIPIFEDLKSLIESYEIHILKGKIIIFEED